MNQFYVSIIFLGLMLIVITFVWIAFDRKNSHDQARMLDGKKEELVQVIADAEQMLEELNKFSDFVVAQMESKNEELCANLKNINERVKRVNVSIPVRAEVRTHQIDKVVNGSAMDIASKPEARMFSYNSDLIIDNNSDTSNSVNNYTHYKSQSKVKEKVIPLNGRHKEVVQLSASGFNDTEIAKRLDMGRGEIQLILGMNR